MVDQKKKNIYIYIYIYILFLCSSELILIYHYREKYYFIFLNTHREEDKTINNREKVYTFQSKLERKVFISFQPDRLNLSENKNKHVYSNICCVTLYLIITL